jgi:hypothetical protein
LADKINRAEIWSVPSLFSAFTPGPTRSLDTRLLQALDRLHVANTALWDAEAKVRVRALPDAEVVALKRAIDRHNLERHAAVAAVDRAADADFPGQRADDDPQAVLGSESIGQMLDRASILHLKIVAMSAEGNMERAAVMQRRLARLARCVRERVEALSRGDATTQAFDEGKTYSA